MLPLAATENYKAGKAIFVDFVLAYKLTCTEWHWHVIKHELDWICKTWTGLITHGLIKHGVIKRELIKHGLIKHGVIKHG